MSRSNQYDDLDEMSVPQGQTYAVEDDIKVGKPPKAPEQKAKQPKKTPYQLQKEEEQRRKNRRTIAIVAAVFAAALIGVIALGIAMMARVPQDNTGRIIKAEADPDKTAYYNDTNTPKMGSDGVHGVLKEVYYTVDGALAVTLKLSNGTAKEQEVTRISARLFNAAEETVAQQTMDASDFQVACRVPAMGYGEVYFIIDNENVVLRNDPLSQLGVTLEIGCNPTDGSNMTTKPQGAQVGDGPKDIADGRTFYENTANVPELSVEGVRASLVRARYTNDGSLVINLSLSNGTASQQKVSAIDISIGNGETGKTVAACKFENLTSDSPVLAVGSYGEMELTIDTADVSIKDDALSNLSCTISVTASGSPAATTQSAAAQ